TDRPPLAMGPDAFRDQVEAQLREHERGGPPLAVITVRCITTRKWIDVVGAAILRRDRFGMLTDSMACLLLVGRSPESAAQTAAAIEAHLKRIGAHPTIDVRICPRDGTTVSALMPSTPSAVPSERAVRIDTSRPSPPANSAAMRNLDHMIGEVAASPISVLIL